MIKTDLDKYFIDAYKEIELYAIKAINLNKRNVDIVTVMNECYLYLLTKILELKTDKCVISYSKTWIKNNLLWHNSPLLRRELSRHGHLELIEEITYDGVLTPEINYDAIKMGFFNSLSHYDKRLFNIYFNLELQKGREIADYLDISLSGAYLIKNECKQLEDRYRNYIKKQTII